MAVGIISDIIQDSYTDLQYNKSKQLMYARYDRVFTVHSINTGTVDPEMIQAFAIATVQASVPVNTPHPDCADATTRYYRAKPLKSIDAVEVVVTYLYAFEPAYLSQYTIEYDFKVAQTITDVEYKADYSGLQPIAVNYWRNWQLDNSGASPTIPTKPTGADNTPIAAYGSCSDFKMVGGMTVTKTIDEGIADLLASQKTQYLMCVNSNKWRDEPAGTWFCDLISTIDNANTGETIARLHFSFDAEGWEPFARFHNDQYGTPNNCWRDPNDTSPYSQNSSNGIKKVRRRKKVNFDSLLAIL